MKYKQPSLSSAVRFEKAPLAQLEHSKMSCNPRVYTTYNAGDIVPVFVKRYCHILLLVLMSILLIDF